MPDKLEICNVGVVGLGAMGGQLARHLCEAGFVVTGHDVRDEAMESAEQSGVDRAASLSDIAARSDLVIIGVGFDSEVEAVIFGDDALLAGARPGTVIAIASTAAPATMKKIVARADRPDLTFLDIPMCRGEQAAIDGKLLIMGGGDAAAFDACRPAFETFSNSIHYLGELGAGQVGKLVNNLILWACISANYEGLKLAESLDVDAAPLVTALLDSSAHNWAMESGVGALPMPWAEKDMTIVLREADEARVSLPLSGTIKEVIKGIKIELGQDMPKVTS
ncbi:MAG: NAD(P)-dependent oxidoreductase [Pseudomonadota bacterium]|nr:NAD(P)-dependent oxidoreductase [Pseudomonadota bacterium]